MNVFTRGRASQGQICHLCKPLGLLRTGNNQEDFANGLPRGVSGVQHEEPWHEIACHDTLKGKIRHGRSIVSENDSVMLGSPSQDLWIIAAKEADILNANHIKLRLLQQQAAENISVEIFVGKKLQHRRCLTLVVGPPNAGGFRSCCLPGS